MGAWTLFQVAGTEFRLDVTFAFLFGWLVVSALAFSGVDAAIAQAIFVAIIFGSVALHEVGHLLAARMFGIQTRNVTLTLFGGYAEFVRPPQTWGAEIIVAVAGPAVNLGIAALLLASAGDFSLSAIQLRLAGINFTMLHQIVWVNLLLGLFNLIPALPLDGGRILRGLLSPSFGLRAGTLVPAWIGVGLGVFVAVYGVLDRDTLRAIIGIYMAFAAWNWVIWGRGIANRPGGGGGSSPKQ